SRPAGSLSRAPLPCSPWRRSPPPPRRTPRPLPPDTPRSTGTIIVIATATGTGTATATTTGTGTGTGTAATTTAGTTRRIGSATSCAECSAAADRARARTPNSPECGPELSGPQQRNGRQNPDRPAGISAEPARAQHLSQLPGLVPDTVAGHGYAESVTG